MTVPSALPTYVPGGRYLCKVVADPVQRASQFKEGTFYLELSLQIRNEKGQWFEWPLATTLKSPRYHQILQVCGGQILPSGITQGPETLVGKQFIAKIGEKLSRDKTRTVNEVLEVSSYVPKKKVVPVSEEPEEPTAESEEPDSFPDTEPLEGDDVPF